MKQLRHLVLDFSENLFGGGPSTAGLGRAIRCMDRLISLSLCLRSCGLDSPAVESLLQAIDTSKALAMLKTFIFDINGNAEVGPDIASLLGSVIERKINLHTVQGDLSFTGTDDAGCAALASGVSGHPRLLALELLFHGCTVSVDMKQRVGRLCQEISSRRRPDEGRDSPDVQRMMRQRTL
jgi:hypothetical protein